MNLGADTDADSTPSSSVLAGAVCRSAGTVCHRLQASAAACPPSRTARCRHVRLGDIPVYKPGTCCSTASVEEVERAHRGSWQRPQKHLLSQAHPLPNWSCRTSFLRDVELHPCARQPQGQMPTQV